MVAIFSFSIFVIVHYALGVNLADGSDASREYGVMLAMMKAGTWNIRHNEVNLVSCLFTTYLPSLVANVTSWPSDMVYRLFPCLLISWTPLLVYDIARRYTGRLISLLVALAFLGQNYYLWSASYARAGIAVFFFALGVWTMFGGIRGWIKWTLVPVCLAGITFAHYGTTFMTLTMLVLWLTAKTVTRSRAAQPSSPKLLLFVCVPMVIFSLFWYGLVNQIVAGYAVRFVETTVGQAVDAANSLSPNTTPSSQTQPQPLQTGDAKSPQEDGTPHINIIPRQEDSPSFFSLDSRDTVVQVAFGKTFPTMNSAQRTEFVVSWILMLLMSFGVAYRLKNREQLSFLGIACYILLVAAVVSPYISWAYGVTKVYYQGSVVMLPCMGAGLDFLKQRHKFVLPAACLVVAVYVLCTTGTLHHILGYAR